MDKALESVIKKYTDRFDKKGDIGSGKQLFLLTLHNNFIKINIDKGIRKSG